MSINITIGGELAFPSNYIGEPDLKGREVTLTIAKVQRDNLQMKGGRKQKKIVLYFVERPEKMMVCNKTNATTIAGMYGGEMRGWAGKRITLYPTTTTFGRETVPCVRVREEMPPQNGGGERHQDLERLERPERPPRDPGEPPGEVIETELPTGDGDVPDVTSLEVYYEFMEQIAQRDSLSPTEFDAGMSAVGVMHAVMTQNSKGALARATVAKAAHEKRLDWKTGRILAAAVAGKLGADGKING